MRLLLLSNSTNFGAGYLDHALPRVRGLFAGLARIAFVPFALQDRAAYSAKARARFECLGMAVDEVTADAAGCRTLLSAAGVFVGGGNTFRLLDTLQRSGMLHLLRDRARAGMPYLGASAGTNIAAPTICTTNDMPIVQPFSFEAMALVRFQINPHYVDADPASQHMGETREDRLREFHEEHETPVVGIREGAWLEVEDAAVTLGGGSARLFRRGRSAAEIAAGARIDRLLAD